MKAILLGFVALGAVALVAFGARGHYQSRRFAPTILVSVKDQTPIGGFSNSVPAVDGFIAHGSDILPQTGNRAYLVDATYRLISSANGNLAIQAHFVVNDNGDGFKDVDRVLPVYGAKPDRAMWTQLNTQLSAFAYFDGTTRPY